MNTSSAEPLPSSFTAFADGLAPPSALRAAVTAAYRRSEPEALPPLLAQARLPADQAGQAHALAHRIAQQLRNRKNASGRAGLVQNLLQEYALSSQEGVALMCLAEALLRIPDAATRDALIRDKIAQGQWQTHVGKSPSVRQRRHLGTADHGQAGSHAQRDGAVRRDHAGHRQGRRAADPQGRGHGDAHDGRAVRHRRNIARRWRTRASGGAGLRYSFDMLGEAALTADDAQRYLRGLRRRHPRHRQGLCRARHLRGPGISIKLSALHPRYSRAQYARVMGELYPDLVRAHALASSYDIGLNIDAEEADRLEISLDLLERSRFEPQLHRLERARLRDPGVPEALPFRDRLRGRPGAAQPQRRLMIRLVKGAYWDSEIKRAQLDGQDGYPVYTRKPTPTCRTSPARASCSPRPGGVPAVRHAQRAHAGRHLRTGRRPVALHARAVRVPVPARHGRAPVRTGGRAPGGKLGRPCRIYAPVGTHETLLAYLVRRLLENGANTSFVNRIADQSISARRAGARPRLHGRRIRAQEGATGLPHPAIRCPRRCTARNAEQFARHRPGQRATAACAGRRLNDGARAHWHARPLLPKGSPARARPWRHR
jgi:RHH-type proline utilization regulon transcriptional repressor/proline dehydrogenase/delta 1-pyrroline-5-carboxylate dehydrogenase